MLSEHLIKKGVCVSVLTRSLKGLPSFETVRGIPVHRAIKTLPWGKWFGITYILSVLWFLYAKRHTYNIIHCHILQGFHSAAAVLFKRLFGKRVIIKAAATGPLSDFKILKKIFLGSFFLRQIKHADQIISICALSKQEAIEEGFSPLSVVHIPGGVDTIVFKPALPGAASFDRILFIGRLDYMKGVHVLIKAFSKIWKQYPYLHLDIIGDGPDKDKLKRMCVDLCIDNFISFHGTVTETVKYLHKSRLFVLPSLSEGFSNVILEAMACGLPVVAANVGGTPDIIQNGINGLLVEPDSPDQIFDAVMKIINNRDMAKKLGAEARKTVENNFSMEQIADRYISLYRDLG